MKKEIKQLRAELQNIANEIIGWDVEDGIKQSFEAVNLLLLASLALKEFEPDTAPLIVNALNNVWNLIRDEISIVGVEENELSESQKKVLKQLDQIIKKLEEVQNEK
ncbi:MAG: hypothetical protein JHC30_05940 [Caldisericum sp.]|jgi:hypothetical protein|nr:hypothetical protein [Caldisericum sp.]